MPDVQELRIEDGVVPCRDEECHGQAEVERDGEHAYYECRDCGFTFGYIRLAENQDTCAIGVPEDLRRRMSQGMEQAMEAEQRSQPIPLQLGRKPG